MNRNNRKNSGMITKFFLAASLVTVSVHGVNKFLESIAKFELSKHKNDSKYYDWKYGKVRYIKKGSGKPLLLLHSFNTSMGIKEWDKNIDMLSKHYTVYALEFLGFGHSEKPIISFSAYLFSCLVNDFIRDIIKESVYAVASGGASGICIASSILMPKNFQKIILISPSGAGSMNVPAKGFVKRLFDIPVFGTAFYNMINSRLVLKRTLSFNSAVSNELVDACHLSAHDNIEGAKCSFAASASNFINVDLEKMIGKSTHPIHIIWGDKDPVNSISNYDGLEKNNNTLTMSVFEGLKQYPHYEAPKIFFKDCRWFFKP